MTMPDSAPIEVSSTMPTFLRWGLGIFGGVIAVVALSELWRGVWPLSIVTPIFALMVGIALFAGGNLLFGAILGPDEVWRIETGRLTIRQSLRGIRAVLEYGSADIAAIKVETSEWDSKPETYGLTIRLVTGKVLKSPEFGTELKANAALAMLTASH